MNRTKDYILASDKEKERLQLQARVWESETEAMLNCIGLQPGRSCLDLGCGAMGILGPLSRQVGPDGQVLGVDSDPNLLAAAHVYVQEEGLTNVELLEADVYDTDLPHASFDLVHERFVFPHVASPEKMLDKMIALTKPGGVVAVQEADQYSWNFFPERPKWPRLKQIIEATFALRSDINIGRRTYGFLRQAGLEDVQIRAAVLALQNSHPYMRMPIIGVTAMRQRIIEAGLSTDAELDDLLADLEQCTSLPETFMITFTVTQVWGCKPLAV
jgi:2-polyprenyl-3-methyl-5-hydroxy-6-metoxy-1,4-benzoquinol methylase